jgi:hypothetical protein
VREPRFLGMGSVQKVPPCVSCPPPSPSLAGQNRGRSFFTLQVVQNQVGQKQDSPQKEYGHVVLCLFGKESNFIEDVEAGTLHSQLAYTEYPDKRRDEWQTQVIPRLRTIPLHILVNQCAGKFSRRALINLRAGRSRPHPKNQRMLSEIIREFKCANN